LIRTWHIGPRAFAKTAFTGKGGLLAGGRWHHAGRAIVYMADSLSLAALEVLAHVRSVDDISDLVAQSADIPDDLPQDRVDAASLPRRWGDPVPVDQTKLIGDRWLQRGRTAVLWVPSAHVVQQRNALLNPTHADFAKIVVGKALPYRFDPRIKERLT
jgi:RES domain-containing protein